MMTVMAPVSMKSQTIFNFLKPTRPPQLTHRLFGKVPSPTTHLLRAEGAFKDLLAQLEVILIHQSSAYSLLLDRDCSRVVSGTSNRPFGFLGILCYDSNASLVHRSPIFCLQRMRRRSGGGKKKRRKPVERNLRLTSLIEIHKFKNLHLCYLKNLNPTMIFQRNSKYN